MEATGPNAFGDRKSQKKNDVTIKMGNDGSLHVSQVKVNMLSIYENVNVMGTGSTAKLRVSTISHDSQPVHFDGWLDEDSHTDMNYAGFTFTILSMKNYSCDVDPFLGTYQNITDMPVVRATTAVQISVDEMDASLFNGNLVYDAGLSICTDPYDAHRQLGIKDPDWGLLVSMVRR
eukprot:2091635-Ditylum_brightwellii.AAC.1